MDMDLEGGDTIYVEAVIGRAVRLTLQHSVPGSGRTTRLTTEEARTLANALLGAAIEAEEYVVYRP
jgi:hypothetical protein